MSKQETIEKIKRENAEFSHPRQAVSLAELLDIVSSDIYAEGERFIFELLQNADDESNGGLGEAHFHLIDDFLVVGHYGKPFDEQDVEGITSAGQGTKRKDPTKTGYKGIGFKSVFGQSDWVAIVSNGYCFRFDKSFRHPEFPNAKMPWQTIPVWTDLDEMPTEVQSLLVRENYTVATVIRLNDASKVSAYLASICKDGWVLLFLRNLTSIKFFDGPTEVISIQKEWKDGFVQLSNEAGVLSQWILEHFRPIPVPPETKKLLAQDRDSPAKLAEADFTEISFAAHVSNDDLVRLRQSHIFTYLPTSVRDFHLPFLVNGNFLVTAARTHLHEDRYWNEWLIQQAAVYFLEWMSKLAAGNRLERPSFEYQLLELLPKPIEKTENELVRLFYQALTDRIGNYSFVPCIDQIHRPITEVVLDESNFTHRQILDPEALIPFVNQTYEKNFENGAIIHRFTKGTKYLKDYGVIVFSEDDLKNFFRSEIIQRYITISNNLKVLKYLRDLHAKDSLQNEWEYIIHNYPFILTDKGELEKIPLACFPTGTYTTEFGGEVTVIHPDLFVEIAQDASLMAWLSDIGVKEPSDLSYLEKEIIGRIDSVVNDQNYLEITGYIYYLFQKGKLSSYHLYSLRKLKVKTGSGTFINAVDCYLSDAYNPAFPLSDFKVEAPLVSESYLKSTEHSDEDSWREFFLAIGVSDDLNIINNYEVKLTSGGFPIQYRNALVRYAKEDHIYPHLISPSYPAWIDYITFLNNVSTFEFARIFWNRFIEKYDLLSIQNTSSSQSHGPKREGRKFSLSKGEFDEIDWIQWGYYGSRTIIPGYITWFIQNRRCLPVVTGRLAKAGETYANFDWIKDLTGNYLPVLDVEREVTSNWIKFFQLKTELRDADLLLVLDSITEDLNDQNRIKRQNQKRIGLLYNELSKRCQHWLDDEKDRIRTWAQNASLATENLTTAPAKEVYWVKIPGFETARDHIPTLYLPGNVEFTLQLETLACLLGVQIVESFRISAKNEVSKDDLRIKALESLPFMAVFLHSKFFINDTIAFLEEALSLTLSTRFIQSNDIQLFLEVEDFDIPGPEVKAIYHDKQLAYHVQWRSPLVRYALAKELDRMYNSGGVGTEWQLLLELNTHEAEEWLKGQGMEINAVLEAPVYQKIQEAILELKTKDQPPKLDRTPISIGEPTIPIPTGPDRGNGKQEKIEIHVQAKLNLWEKCLGINELDFDWLVKALSWEYEQSKFELSFQKRLRFKHVYLTPSGKLALSEVDAEELPPFLSYLKELHPEEMVLEVRNFRKKKRVFASFSIIEIRDSTVTLSVKGFDMEILPGATANLVLPAENILLRTLLDQWKNSIEKNQLLSAQSLVDWFRNQVPHHRLGFVFGPPGTGKTTELARRICASLAQNLRIIALAPTNRAADALYIRVLEQKKNSGLNDIVVQRFGPSAKESWLEEGMPCVVITTIHRFVFDKFVNGNRLINTEWDYLVIDEASMIPLPYLMLPLVHGRFKKGSHDGGGLKHQFTIAGDPFQLLPVGLTPSLGDLIDFERLKEDSQNLRGFTTENIYTLLQIDRFDIRHTNAGNGYVIDTLTHNYRSLPSIVHLFSRFLYLSGDGTEILTSNFEEGQKRSILTDTILPVITLVNFPVKLYKTGKAHHANNIYRYGNGAYHIYSALLATALVRQLLLDNPVKSIGLVSPYTRQVKLCEAMLKPILQTASNRISVSTVHRFQGEEADIIILLLNPSSGTDTNGGQLISGYLSHFNNRNLLNVAISRPKSTLIVLKPEDVFLRSRNAGYVFNDEVTSQNQIADLDIQHLHASQLEQILFGKEVLRKLAYLDTIRSFDVFRTQHLQEQNIDWIFLIGAKNLQVILAREVEKNLLDLNYS